jgi:hypothetical protein
MSLLSDLVNGKEILLSSGSKMTIAYKVDANVMSISIGGSSADLSSDDVSKLIQFETILRAIKNLEAKV